MQSIKKIMSNNKLGYILTAFTMLVNILSLGIIPDYLGVHFSGGQVDGLIPKFEFIFFIPVIMLIFNIYYYFRKKNAIPGSVVLFVTNLVLILINL